MNAAAETSTRAPGSLAGAVLVCVVTLCALAPFVNKPFHIDDTVFVRVAMQIIEDPLHPYNFKYSWSGSHSLMWKQTQHPPLHSYFLAIPGLFGGFSELAVHVAYLAFAVGCVLVMYSLAARFCSHPTLATLLTACTPAFLVSATTAMADVPLLFFWLLAVRETVRADDNSRPMQLWRAGLAATAATMTKYYGIALVPLLVVYWHVRRRRANVTRPGRISLHLAALWLPAAVLLAWGSYSFVHVGFFHPLGAADAAVGNKAWWHLFANSWHTIAFVGGSMVWPVFLLPLVGRLAAMDRYIVAAAAVGAVGARTWQIFDDFPWAPSQLPVGFLVLDIGMYAALFTAGAFCLIAVARTLERDFDTSSLLLGLWIFGTLFFAAIVNWVVNTRVILPAVFPIGLVLVRWIEGFEVPHRVLRNLQIAVVPTLAVAILVGAADYDTAAAAKEFAETEVGPLIESEENVYFSGNWGLQWYMEEEGAIPVDAAVGSIDDGDILIYQTGNVNVYPEVPADIIYDHSPRTPLYLNTMRSSTGAGFYACVRTGLPFAFCPDGLIDRFVIYRVGGNHYKWWEGAGHQPSEEQSPEPDIGDGG